MAFSRADEGPGVEGRGSADGWNTQDDGIVSSFAPGGTAYLYDSGLEEGRVCVTMDGESIDTCPIRGACGAWSGSGTWAQLELELFATEGAAIATASSEAEYHRSSPSSGWLTAGSVEWRVGDGSHLSCGFSNVFILWAFDAESQEEFTLIQGQTCQ